MNVKNSYAKENISLLGLTSDFVTEEECSISNFYKAYCNDNLYMKMEIIQFDEQEIPVLLISNENLTIERYYECNALEKLKRELEWDKKRFNKYVKNIDSIKELSFDSISSYGEIQTETFNNVYIEKNNNMLYKALFKTIFSGGCETHCVAISPNVYNAYANEKELRKVGHTYVLKQNTKLFRNKEVILEILNRKDILAKETTSILTNIFKAYNEELLCVMGSRNLFGTGLNFITINSKENKELMKKHKKLSVYDITKIGNEEMLFIKSDEEIEKELVYIKELEKEEKDFIKELEKVKQKLEKAKKRWFSLSSVTKGETGWKVWLNPEQQYKYNYGWFSLEELELWIEEKGPICNI